MLCACGSIGDKSGGEVGGTVKVKVVNGWK